jgi:hypothetical protein
MVVRLAHCQVNDRAQLARSSKADLNLDVNR